MLPSAPVHPKSSVKRSTAKSTPTKSPRQPTQKQTLQVPLPGMLYQRGDRWWWNVKLPGEDQPKARPLKPDGTDAATDDLGVAQRVALAMWEGTLTEVAERRARAEADQTVAKLKAQFLGKVRDFSQVVETTRTKLEAETQARVEAEAKLQTLTSRAMETTVCECCGAAGIPMASVRRIDSGQLLCPACLAALRAEVKRIRSHAFAGCHA